MPFPFSCVVCMGLWVFHNYWANGYWILWTSKQFKAPGWPHPQKLAAPCPRSKATSRAGCFGNALTRGLFFLPGIIKTVAVKKKTKKNSLSSCDPRRVSVGGALACHGQKESCSIYTRWVSLLCPQGITEKEKGFSRKFNSGISKIYEMLCPKMERSWCAW